MQTTRDLAAFLLARLDEDEQVARAATPGPWEYQDVDSVGGGRICDPTVAIVDLHYEQPGEVDPRIRRTVLSDEADRTGAHIARHDPARVLADIAMKRRIVELHGDPHGCLDWETSSAYPYLGCNTLRLLALPYATHPDYRTEWLL